MNEDEGKSTGAGVSAVYQINRRQLPSNQAFGSQPNAGQLAEVGTRLPPKQVRPLGEGVFAGYNPKSEATTVGAPRTERDSFRFFSYAGKS